MNVIRNNGVMERVILYFVPIVVLIFSIEIKANLVRQDQPIIDTLFPIEEECFAINSVELTGVNKFSNETKLKKIAQDAYGHCLGEQGLSILTNQLKNQLIADGYITSTLVIPEQRLDGGTLYITLTPGLINNIVYEATNDNYAQLNTIFPSKSGDLLNLRHLEQGLDNLQRLPTVNATMDVAINRDDLSSDIIIKRQQSRFFRINTFLDDAGNDIFGRYRVGGTLFLDNPFSLSDLAYFSTSRDFDYHHDKGHNYFSLHYSLPYGNWLLSMTGSRGSRYQSLLLAETAFKYQTRWHSLDMQTQRLVMRGYNYKAVANAGVLIRNTNRFLGDIEIGVQRLNTIDWQLGLQYLYYSHWGTFNGGVTYQQGTNWFSARPAPGLTGGVAARLINVNASLDIPFQLGEQRFHYQPIFSQQYTRSNLTIQDNFLIGGRGSVRGFNEGSALADSGGWFLRNEVAWYSPVAGLQLYAGIDYGQVVEENKPLLSGNALAGAASGFRGRYHQIGYDFYFAIPLIKPANFSTDSLVSGFAISWQY
ncbi:ShlB/FhaC/HecB family hemolysin secretion/activation protein [Yersinia sp. Marseille-Q3913]|uniref:ShlB/FhaC/HecB family hemolysin secretion/activation protein n=2 Tax=Yersinia sp. Marseille-Q3913 TaxID=2830769 RepID=UPI001BB050D1|nr:ShlB/FhaC/HecB family hemolysin secretion/activation protein [Yersinia sp. Marseille-Q3913]MBS0056982.1 ShlB/FhaC/HecB family hemolysin secretion/activation protein [Yersinia sp. Marseille-Q3913]